VRKNILFHRDYRGFSGGHLKVGDYFNHAKFSSQYRPQIYLTPQSDAVHPWFSEEAKVDYYNPESASVIFVAGMDWTALSRYPKIEERIPVINLIQGVRHALPSSPLFGFLSRQAIRICVSREVAKALEATKQCNGPIHVVPNGIDFGLLPNTACLSSEAVFIGGLKQPGLASVLAKRLRAKGFAVKCFTNRLPRSEFLAQMASAKVAVLLPLQNEGFYLPALEAMAMGLTVVCPDCLGNRSFCIDRVTALTPPLDLDRIEADVHAAMHDVELARSLRNGGKKISRRHDICTERQRFLTILHQISQA
jgi:glycosyltransferase involved in cell wall biosynthesis